MDQIKLMSMARYLNIFNELGSTKDLLADKVVTIGNYKSGILDNISYRATIKSIDRKLEKHITSLRKSSPIKGTNAALQRTIYSIEKTKGKIHCFESVNEFDEQELQQEIRSVLSELGLVINGIVDFGNKSQRCIIREMKDIAISMLTPIIGGNEEISKKDIELFIDRRFKEFKEALQNESATF